MMNPAYNVQAVVSNQIVISYDVFQNPTDIKTLITLIKKMNAEGTLESIVVADMVYGWEANYRFFENEMSEVTAFIPYNTIFREASHKWRSDDSKVMNWAYDETNAAIYARRNEDSFWYRQIYGTRSGKLENRNRVGYDGIKPRLL